MNTQPFVNKHRQVLLNGWVLIYELSGCGFKSSYSHLNKEFGRKNWKPCCESQIATCYVEPWKFIIIQLDRLPK